MGPGSGVWGRVSGGLGGGGAGKQKSPLESSEK